MDKVFKRGLCFLLIIAMFASLAACGSGSTADQKSTGNGQASGPDSSANAASDGETITLRILENDTAKKEGYLDALLAAFNEAFADRGITAVDANMDEYTDLAQNGPYGFGPDVVYQANDILMKNAEDRHIIPLNKDDYECSSFIPEAAWDAFKISVDGTSYICGIPVNIQEPMFFYRKDRLPENWENEWDRDADSVPDFFENWNDLYAYSKLLRDSDESANHDSRYGFMTSWNDMYMNGEFLFSYGAYVFGENEDGTLSAKDIGLNSGNAAKGMLALKTFAALMNEGCIDDTVTANRYEKLADGTYFCAVSTPDTYVLFFNKLALAYQNEGLSEEEAKKKAEENLVMTELPVKMPADGDLTKPAASMSGNDWVNTRVMGGVNGYGISSYTEHRDACIAFVNFATGYDMIARRAELLGIAPTRSDVAQKSGGVTEMIFTSLAEGRIYLMPSLKALNQVWTPVHTMLSDIGKDPFRTSAGEAEKYTDEAALQTALDNVNSQIYDSIFTLSD